MWLLFFFEFKAIIWVRTSPHIFVILHSPSYFMHTNNYKWPTKHSWQYWIIVHSLLVLCRVITFSPLVGGPSIREFQVRLFFFFFLWHFNEYKSCNYHLQMKKCIEIEFFSHQRSVWLYITSYSTSFICEVCWVFPYLPCIFSSLRL